MCIKCTHTNTHTKSHTLSKNLPKREINLVNNQLNILLSSKSKSNLSRPQIIHMIFFFFLLYLIFSCLSEIFESLCAINKYSAKPWNVINWLYGILIKIWIKIHILRKYAITVLLTREIAIVFKSGPILWSPSRES